MPPAAFSWMAGARRRILRTMHHIPPAKIWFDPQARVFQGSQPYVKFARFVAETGAPRAPHETNSRYTARILRAAGLPVDFQGSPPPWPPPRNPA